MQHRIINTLQRLSVAAGVLTLVWSIDLLVWQHQAVLHHAAHFEVNSWGVTRFHWNDECAQAVNPDDCIIPPPEHK
jgi:hypothetical protein